jgi:predicted MFS family arabinose efflux permease
MGVRAATGQFGYLVGAAVGGAALAAGGYEMLGFSLATLFVLGTIPHLTAVVLEARKRRLKNGFDVRLREAASSSAS